MKKTAKLIIFVMLVALVGCLFFTSCTFVKVNDERESNMVVATVSTTYQGKDLSLKVTRNELLSYVNYIINMYNSYGIKYDVTTILSSGLNSLVKQKYQVLNGMIYLYEKAQSDPARKAAMYMTFKGETQLTAENVLTLAERYNAINDTNKTFDTSIETYVKEYKTTDRQKATSMVKESINSAFSNGYTVALNNSKATDPQIYVYHKTEAGEYVKGLASKYYVDTADLSYEDVYIEVNLVKGTDTQKFYLPVSEATFSTADGVVKELKDDDALQKEIKDEVTAYNTYYKYKKATVTFDEPDGKDDDGETKYKTYSVTADYISVTPRVKGETTDESGNKTTEEEEATDYLKDYRYYTDADFSKDDAPALAKELVEKGKLFNHSPSTTSDAEKDAYRQFREGKKAALINFDATAGAPYNGLSYYYLSSFESAVLTAVQHETGRVVADLTDSEITATYEAMVLKQKEEYDALSIQAQVDKFATAIGSSLETVYYIPYDALAKTFYDTGDDYKVDKTADASDLNYKVGDAIKAGDPIYRAYATTNSDGTVTLDFYYVGHILTKFGDAFMAKYKEYNDYKDNADKHQSIILDIAEDELKIITSKKEYLDEKKFDKIGDLFEVDEVTGKLKELGFNDFLTYIKTELDKAKAENGNVVETFRELMIKFNDDSGKMSNDLGYMMAMGDKVKLNWTENFTKTAQDLYKQGLKADVDKMDGIYSVNGKDLAYTVVESSNYSGIHTEIISYAPFYKMSVGTKADLMTKSLCNIGTAETPVYCLGLKMNLTLVKEGDDAVTHYKNVKEATETTLKTAEYDKWSKKFTTTDALNSATIVQKAFKKLASALGLNK